jgi:hypothetical protein
MTDTTEVTLAYLHLTRLSLQNGAQKARKK